MNTARRINQLAGKTSRVPALVLGADGNVAPSNRISLGFIGTGRQVFHANLPWHLQSEEVQVVAVCDVDSRRLQSRIMTDG